MKIQDKSIVAMHYKLMNDDGDVVDTSEGQEPYIFMQGTNAVIPGLERGIAGKSAGDKLHLVIQPEDAYGPVIKELIRTAKPEAFNGVEDVKAGMSFTARGPEGQVQQVLVEEVTEEGIKVNANHPLAGKVLSFDVNIVEVRQPSPEELDEFTQNIDDMDQA